MLSNWFLIFIAFLHFFILEVSFATELKFYAVSELPEGSVHEKVINGIKISKDDWESTFYLEFPHMCTAQLVGSKVILTAAHCLCSNQKKQELCNPSDSIMVVINGRSIQGSCAVHPKYVKFGDSHDYALCKIEEEIDNLYETINIDPDRLARSNELWLMGFGCVEIGGPISRDLYYGIAEIRNPAGYDTKNPSYLMTMDRVAVCKGDSGGAAYLGEPPDTRVIVAINSSNNSIENPDKIQSLLASTSTKEAIDFFRHWSSKNGGICGITPNMQNCHQ